MKIGLLQEGEVRPDQTIPQRYEELIQEVKQADRSGFYSWGTSEQHFSPPRFTVSAPEVLYAAIARETKDIRIRIMCAVMLAWNHPILVAERLATLDIVSGGRAEIATARANNLITLEAFGVSPKDTRAQWEDGMALLAKIFKDEIVEHDGPFWKVPPRTIVPRPVQSPHPAVSVAASSIETHISAGERGIGVLTFENYFGFDYLQDCIDGFREGQKKQKPTFPGINNDLGLYVATAFCAKDREEAKRIARDVAFGYFHFIVDLYTPLGKRESYEYLDDKMRRLVDNLDSYDFLLNETPSVMIGTPDDFIARLHDLEARGVDEVLLRVDGVPHADIMQSLELIGAEVIPHFHK